MDARILSRLAVVKLGSHSMSNEQAKEPNGLMLALSSDNRKEKASYAQKSAFQGPRKLDGTDVGFSRHSLSLQLGWIRGETVNGYSCG